MRRTSDFTALIQKLRRGENAALVLISNAVEYIRKFEKKERLILLGGGHISLDVYRMAKMLDFEITVVDDRPLFADRERFSECEVICKDFDSAIRDLQITERDYVCVLTRGHRYDKECVEAILSGTMPYYLGMIGSKRRVAGLKEALIEEGFPETSVSALNAPIGLNIGSLTTAEIALSICAQLVQKRRSIPYVCRGNELLQTNVNMELLHDLAEGTEPRALITVLRSDGSTPVKSGSMMAVDQLGHTIGTIGGGCSEAAAIVKARHIIGSGKSVEMTIDMSNEVAADNGMVCGGEMTILIEDILTE